MSDGTDMRHLQPNEEKLVHQTSQWLQILKSDEPEGRAAFVAWLKESPRHVREYLSMVAFDRELAGLDSRHQHDVQALLAEARGNVVALQNTAEDLRQTPSIPAHRVADLRRKSKAVAALAASVSVAIAGYWFMNRGWQDFSTAVGEQRIVELEDGSVVQLNTRSHLEVRLSGQVRELRLLAGEAVFKVRPDNTRPFRVHTDTAVIQAIGTQFNVYRDARGTQVSVLEGTVRVSEPGRQGSTQLVAGEQARIASSRAIVKQPVVDIDRTVAWRQRRLVFEADTLQHIAEEFNRYNRKPQVRLDSEVSMRRYTGTFDVEDPESLALLLREEHDLLVIETPETIHIRPRSPTDARGR